MRRRGRGGTRQGRVRASATTQSSAVAARAHERQREGDEGDPDERQRLTETRGTRGREGEADRGEEEDDGHGRTARPLARLVGEENGGGAGSRRTATTMRSSWTCGVEPKPAGTTMPRPIVARPPFWLAALVVTSGMARSGGFTEVKPCLLRSPSKMDSYYGKYLGTYKVS